MFGFFSIRGTHEEKRVWYKHGLRNELQGKIKRTKHFFEFEKLLGQFFNTLPLALNLRKKAGVLTQFVKISNGDMLQKWDKGSLFKEFLYAPDYGRPQIFKLSKKSTPIFDKVVTTQKLKNEVPETVSSYSSGPTLSYTKVVISATLYSIEISGSDSMVRPAGLVYAAVASSARPINAPPIALALAPGLLKRKSRKS